MWEVKFAVCKQPDVVFKSISSAQDFIVTCLTYANTTLTLNSHVLQQAIVCCRQPFVIAYAIAAVAWDLASKNAAPEQSEALAAVPGLMDCHHRDRALTMVDEEIVQLMQLSSPFAFATTFQDVMLRYVFMRRALQGRASIDEASFH